MHTYLLRLILTIRHSYATIHSMASMEDIKKMLSTRQAETTSKIAKVDGRMNAAQDSLVQIHQIQGSQIGQQDNDDTQIESCALTGGHASSIPRDLEVHYRIDAGRVGRTRIWRSEQSLH